MKRLGLSPRAKSDLEEIAAYIARDNPLRAESFVLELIAKCKKVAKHPGGYRPRPELGPRIRQAIHGRYLILFRDKTTEVRIERVIHSARDLTKALK